MSPADQWPEPVRDASWVFTEAMRAQAEQQRSALASSLSINAAAIAEAGSLIKSNAQRIAEQQARMRQRFDGLLRSPAYEQIREAAQRAAESWKITWSRAIPDNLVDLDFDLITEALTFCADTGVCVMWAPRAEIVEELVRSDDLDATLVARREEILDDLDSALAAGDAYVHLAQKDARRFATEAVAAARDGHDSAAQALAASALGCILEDVHGFARLAVARERWEGRDLMETDISDVRRVAIQLATLPPLRQTDDEGAVGFNRHGTAHGMASFYGTSEMLAGLLLLVAWVRELSWWAENAPEVFVDA